MPRRDGRLEPGQPLNGAISAGAWNRMMDAADVVHGNRHSVSGDPLDYLYGGLCYVKASYVGAYPAAQFSAVRISSPDNFAGGGTIPQRFYPRCLPAAFGAESIGIIMEPCDSNRVATVAVAGVVQCWLNVVNELHTHCTPETDQTPITVDGTYVFRTRMETGWSGDAEVLWKESGTGTKAGVVRLNAPTRMMLTWTGSYWEYGQCRSVTLYSSPTHSAGGGSVGTPSALAGPQVTACNLLDDIPAGKWVVLQQRDGVISAVSWGPRHPVIYSSFAAPWPKLQNKAIVYEGNTYSVSNPWANVTGTGTKQCAWSITGASSGRLLAAECG